MDCRVFQTLLAVRNLNQSQIAELTGISRQAVSLWTKRDTINLHSQHLQKLGSALGLSVDLLLRPLPVICDAHLSTTLLTSLLWDRLFPNLESFAVALVKNDFRALARLTQVFGIYSACKVVGVSIWKQFPLFKKYIQPVRRQQCEVIWKLHENPDWI